jgi:SHS2 domain-containing protein
VKTKGRRGKGPSRARVEPRSPKPDARRPKSYEFLPHPADVGFLARGKTLEKVFEAAALALCDYGWELARVRARKKLDIRAHAATLEDLLFVWLSEILYETDAAGWVFKTFTVKRVAQPGLFTLSEAEGPAEALAQAGAGNGKKPDLGLLWEIQGVARGEKFSKKRHRARTYIKAVTYHQLAVKQSPAGWSATVYLDV